MAFRYKWDQKTDMGTEKVAIYFYRYDTLKEILEATYGSDFDELAGGQVCGGDGRGGEYNLTFEEIVENIKLMACFGFACKREGENQIHFWVDVDNVDPIDFIGLIAHEKGHLLRPWKKDQMQEELKADRYADTATLAFKVACDVLGLAYRKEGYSTLGVVSGSREQALKEDTGLYQHFITQDDGIQEHEKGNNSGNAPSGCW